MIENDIHKIGYLIKIINYKILFPKKWIYKHK